MNLLTKDYFNKACESIIKHGRPLEKALLQRYFFNGSIEDILDELKKFQNKDGGFGNGIESDFRLPYSSPMATSVGIRILSEIDEHNESKEMVKEAIEYLEKSFNRERNGWFTVPEEVNSFPHAPWWNYDYENGMTVIDRNWGNPSAEILAYIYKYREYVKGLDVDKLVQYAMEYIENKQEFESENEIYCYLELYDVLPEELKKRLEKRLTFAIAQVIEYDENKWKEYLPTPIDFVKELDSSRFGIPEAKIDSNLDFIIEQLETHGKINPPWGMSFYNEDLKEAYDEWIGVLTLKALITLDRFNRISMVLNQLKIKSILGKEKLIYLSTTNGKYPDNSAVCFAYDEKLHLYFGSYSDTLKCRNISQNPYVAVSVGTLQIHGIAKIVSYGSEEYKNKREIYDRRFPQYVSVFEKIDNELYEIFPLVIWNYNPSFGEMNRDELIFDLEYYKSISPYKFHKYNDRSK